jgi:uncharacterized protein (DUF58 family)
VLLIPGLVGISFFRTINLLLLLSYLLLGVLLVNLVRAGRRLKDLQAVRRIEDPLFAGVPGRVEIQLRSRRRQVGFRVEEEGPQGKQRWFIPELAGQRSLSVSYPLLPLGRGRHSWGPVLAASGYPFGLVERHRVLVESEEVIVLPAVGWLHRGLLRHYLRSQGEAHERQRRRPQPHPTAQAEIHGLRSYHPGDNPRLIHWRTSARRGQLMVREMEDVPSDSLLLVVDPVLRSTDEGATEAEAFEDAISLAATVCWEWCRHPGDRLVLGIGGPRPQVIDGFTGPWHARRTLEALATLSACPPGTDGLVALLAQLALPSVVVLLIAVGPSDLAGALGQALRRPVNTLDAGQARSFPFYEPPETMESRLLGGRRKEKS